MNNLFIKQTETMGRGVFTRRPIQKGHIIEEAPVILVPNEDDFHFQKTALRFYCFNTHTSGNSCVALGYGSLYNHAPMGIANTTYLFDSINNLMVFKADRDIEEGEQLFVYYGYDPVLEGQRWETRKLQEKKDLEDKFVGTDYNPPAHDDIPDKVGLKNIPGALQLVNS